MRGIPTYTQISIAFPGHISPGSYEEIGVHFDARGGGVHGEFTFYWRALDDKHYPNGALQVCSFSDGIGALLDDRILGILHRLNRRQLDRRDIPPETLIEWLEEAGIKPSAYQLKALIERLPQPNEERSRLQKQLDALKKHEAGPHG